jgi:hypothetical protein
MPREAAMWNMVLLCLMWCLWRERNDRCFEDREWLMGDLKDFFFQDSLPLDICL